MAWVKEASAISNASSATCSITVPTGGFPAGHLLILGTTVAVSGVNVPGILISDTAGNTWTVDRSIGPITGTTTYVSQFRAIVASTLAAGTTITATATGNTPNRWAMSLQEFDDTVTGNDTGNINDNGGASSGVITSNSFTTGNANTLIVGTLGLVSAARTLTPGAGYTAGTKIASTNGTGDRAVQVMWRYVSSTGTYTVNGTLSTGSIYGCLAQAYVLTGGGGGGGGRTGKAKVWDGSAWVSHPAKVWDGSAWVTHPMKGNDGSGWIVGK